MDRFNKELQEYFGTQYSFLVSSGKASLTVILQAIRELCPERDEVLIPAFTCYSVPSAIVRAAGFKIRLCDLDPETLDFDYDQLSTILSHSRKNLLCVVAVHLFGIPADIDRLRSVIDDASIVIVEDSAQAMGGERDRRKLGTLGDVGFFSLGRGKAFSTVEGGIILTNRRDIAEHVGRVVDKMPNYGALELIRLFFYALALLIFMRPSLFWLPKALPLLRLGETIYNPYFMMRKMSPFQAGLATRWEKKLLRFNDGRVENALEYLNELKVIGLRPAWAEQRPLSCLIRLPLRVEDKNARESVVRMSERMGLGIARSYPDSVDNIPELAPNFSSGCFPAAKDNAEKLLTLPVHPYVTRKDRVRIVNVLAKVQQT